MNETEQAPFVWGQDEEVDNRPFINQGYPRKQKELDGLNEQLMKNHEYIVELQSSLKFKEECLTILKAEKNLLLALVKERMRING